VTAPEAGLGQPRAIVEAWHDALNSLDLERLVGLSTPDVEVGGPQGAGRGAQLLRDWAARAHIRLEPLRVFQRQDAVFVVEEAAEWTAPESREVTGRQVLASVFRLHDGRVSSVIRHADVASALHAAGLTDADQA